MPNALFGTIKKIVHERGFGFITGDAAAVADHFFHANQTKASFKALSEGDRVSFESTSNDKGFRAIKVDVL